MSSRVLRKLQGASDFDPISQADASSKSGGLEEQDLHVTTNRGARPKKGPVNPFDLLNEDSCSESEVKEDDDLGTEVSRSELQRQDTKKKKKRKTRKKRTSQIQKSSEDNQEFEDEIDRSVYEVDKILGKQSQHPSKGETPNPKASSPSSSTILRQLLAIEYKNLNPENEMKKIFGSRVVQAEVRAHRHHHHHHHHRGGRSRASTRPSGHSIIVPRNAWPNPGKVNGLSMKFVDSDADGNQYFSFEHSQTYQKVEETFYEAVDSVNPQFIVDILNEHPFHINALLQLSDICKMGEDTQVAIELIERALFAMEVAFHPLFNLAVGTSRLKYREQVNRAFFIALFRHLDAIGARGCHRTALEFCKLLYSLDPDSDPTGVLLMMDFYALRAQEFKWMIEFFESQNATKNLSQLPNWSYSIAIAYFYAARDGNKDFNKADEWLQKSLIMFPGVLLPLLDKCSIEPVLVDKHEYFLKAQLNQSVGLALLEKLYVARTYHVWKYPELLPWLERNSKKVMEKVDSGNDAEILESEKRRKTRYQGAPLNLYRHVLMSDLKDVQSSLPTEISAEPVLSFDPLPPKDSVDIYVQESKTGNSQEASVIRNFLNSILPNYNPNDPQSTNNGAEGDDRRVDLHRSVNSLYEAMRELLGNLHLPEVPHDGADSEDSDDELDNPNPNWG